jgi:hypothetical protein
MNELQKLPPLPKLPRKGREPGGRCVVCRCRLTTGGGYADSSVQGRAHATNHHFVAKRFFGTGVFHICPWDIGNKTAVCCYECHEVLLHNPVFTEANLAVFAALVVARGLDEDDKPPTAEKLGGRIRLLHEVIDAGLSALSRAPTERLPVK